MQFQARFASSLILWPSKLTRYAQRLSADKLLKTKWIRSAAKAPISTLSELVLRYEVWSKHKDKEATPTDDLPWDEIGADG